MQPLPLSYPGEFVLLAAQRTVTVTREEHHQDVLAARTGPTIAELRPCTITAGKHAGQDGLEVLLDGHRVGELTRLMAPRYRAMVDDIWARGYRAGCEAVLNMVQMFDFTIVRAHHHAAGAKKEVDETALAARVLGAREVAFRPRSTSARTRQVCPSAS